MCASVRCDGLGEDPFAKPTSISDLLPPDSLLSAVVAAIVSLAVWGRLCVPKTSLYRLLGPTSLSTPGERDSCYVFRFRGVWRNVAPAAR